MSPSAIHSDCIVPAREGCPTGQGVFRSTIATPVPFAQSPATCHTSHVTASHPAPLQVTSFWKNSIDSPFGPSQKKIRIGNAPLPLVVVSVTSFGSIVIL